MKARMGRPPKSGDETLSERLELRVTPTEKAAYDTASEVSGMERSDWIRLVLQKASANSLKKGKRTS